MTNFEITHDGSSWGSWSGETAEEALLACLADSDRTRTWKLEHLSNSASYGKSAPRVSLSGNGAQDTDRFWYVENDGAVAVFSASDAA
jgi:hypothetical protein